MDFIVEDELCAVLGDAVPLDGRARNWLWLYLEENGAKFNSNDFGSSLMDEVMARFIEKERYSIDRLISDYNDSVLPDEYFKWISPKDERQIEYLLQELEREIGIRRSIFPARLLGRNLLIAMIDMWGERISRKQRRLDQLKARWATKLQEDKALDWFRAEKGSEGERCNLAWEWLMRNKLKDSRYSSDSRILARSNPISNHSELLALLDDLKWTEEKKIIFVDKVKKNWSQRNYRKRNEGSKQCNLLLSNEAISRLDELADNYGLTKAKVIEILLKCEMENGLYIADYCKKIGSF